MSGERPERAHSLVLSAGADTAADLADELRRIAAAIERGEITVGCIGGPTVGTMYSYVHRPEITHDRYFSDLDAFLTAEAARA